MTILERIRSRVSAREEHRVATFDELAQRIHAGEELNDDEAAEVLERAGRSVDDLQKAIAHLAERDRLRELAATWGPLNAEQLGVEAERDKAIDRYQTAARVYADEMKSSQERLDKIGRQLSKVAEARATLRRPEFADPALVAQRAQLERQRNSVSADMQAFRHRYPSPDSLRYEEQRERTRIEEQLRQLGHLTREDRDTRHAELQAELAQLPAKTKEREHRWRDLEAQCARLTAEIETVENRMIPD